MTNDKEMTPMRPKPNAVGRRRNKIPVRQPLPPRVPAIFQVVVQCHGEHDQEEVYRRMQAEGRKCRVLTL